MYTEHYGLSAPPFQLTPDARFWFESATHRKAMAYLGYGLQQGEGFITITGDIGAGKTTLVGHLLASIDPMRVEAILIGSTQVGGDDMLRLIAQGLKIPTEGVEKAQLLARVEQHLSDVGRTGRRTLIIVDEAQNLSHAALEELRMLSNVQTGGQALVQILLLGQPEFRERIAQGPELEQLRQRIIASHHLNAMTADETRAYLEHRLALVGWAGNPSFDDAACARLHEVSGGVPRQLNVIATRVMMAAALDGLTRITGKTVDKVAAEWSAEEPAPGPKTVYAAANDHMGDLAARIALLESQSVEQDAALRRILHLLINWVERDDVVAARAPAA